MDYGQLSLNLWNICKVMFYWDQTFSAEMILGDLVETQPSAVDLRLRQRQEIWDEIKRREQSAKVHACYHENGFSWLKRFIIH